MSRSLVVLCDGAHLQRRTGVIAVQRVSAGHYLQHLFRLEVVLEEVKVGGRGSSLRPLRLLKIVGIGAMFTALKAVQLLIVFIIFIIIIV